MANPVLSKRLRFDHGREYFAYWWWCPGCDAPHVFDHRWGFNGDMERPTFDGSYLSRRTLGEERVPEVCHSYVTNGRIAFLADCTHSLVEQTVPMAPIPDWLLAEGTPDGNG